MKFRGRALPDGREGSKVPRRAAVSFFASPRDPVMCMLLPRAGTKIYKDYSVNSVYVVPILNTGDRPVL